ncbi:MAG: VOC family protein [Balneolaceae bacterium]|nr:VOC family protein [Balneolaceae bacterium]
MLKNSINWFEIPVVDFERAKTFYSTIYDFEMPEAQMGKVKMGFFLYEQQPDRVGGAICQGEDYVPSREGALIYLNGGNDLNTVLNRIEDAGGEVLLAKTHIQEDIGYFALFIDTEGNRVALHSRE